MVNNLNFSLLQSADSVVRAKIFSIQKKHNLLDKDYLGYSIFGGHLELLFSDGTENTYTKLSLKREELLDE